VCWQVSLSRAKFTVDVVTTGEDMVSRAPSYKAILFNMQLHDIPAIDAVRRIRANEAASAGSAAADADGSAEPAVAKTTVLLFGIGASNKTTKEDLSEFIEAGLDGHIYAGSVIAKELPTFLAQKRANPGTFLLSNG
jgi:hypothetical protein